MENPNDKPLYSLTVGEFSELFRKVIVETIQEELSHATQQEPKDSSEESHFTIRELTKFLRCSRMSIHNYKKLGLPFYRLGRKILFKKNEVMDFMRRQFGHISTNHSFNK